MGANEVVQRQYPMLATMISIKDNVDQGKEWMMGKKLNIYCSYFIYASIFWISKPAILKMIYTEKKMMHFTRVNFNLNKGK